MVHERSESTITERRQGSSDPGERSSLMNRLLLFSFLAGGGLMIAGSLPSRGCIAIPMPNQNYPSPSIRLDQQRAFLWRDGQKEHMMLSVQYSGGTDEFAWVVPVETRPKVEVDKGAPFTELRRLTAMRPVTRGVAPEATMAAPGGGVQVLERKVEGPYDLAVLSASNSGGLYDWLKSNGFTVTRNVRGALDYYVERHYVFVAARIRPGDKNREKLAERLRNGTIAPLHLSYRAEKLSYPLRVTAGNPGASEMEVYVVNGDGESKPNLRADRFHIVPKGATNFEVSDAASGQTLGTAEFKTLRRLLPRGGTLVKYSGVLQDAQRQQDLVFAKL